MIKLSECSVLVMFIEKRTLASTYEGLWHRCYRPMIHAQVTYSIMAWSICHRRNELFGVRSLTTVLSVYYCRHQIPLFRICYDSGQVVQK